MTCRRNAEFPTKPSKFTMRIKMNKKEVSFFRCETCRGMLIDDSPKTFERHKAHKLKQPVGYLSLLDWIFVYYKFYTSKRI